MRASELQQKILEKLLDGRMEGGTTFMEVYLDLEADFPTTIQAFGRSVAVCHRRDWLKDGYDDGGGRELTITAEGELAFGDGKLSPMINRDRWKKVRGPYIGSSDVAAILGIHEYGKGPWDVWDRIVLGQWREPARVGADIRRGNRQEQSGMDRFHEVHGLETYSQSMVHHPRFHFLVSDVDAVISAKQDWPDELRSNPLWDKVIELNENGAEGAHEVKCPRTRIFYECRDQGLRTEYGTQMQMHLMAGGFDWGIFTLYDAQYDDIQSFPVTRHENFIEHLEKGLPKWYERYVVGRVRPLHPDPPPPQWPPKVGGNAQELEGKNLVAQALLVKLRHHELEEAKKNYDDTVELLTDELPEEGQKFFADSITVERKSSSIRRQFDRNAFVAALTMLQQEMDHDGLMELGPNEDRFWYNAGGKDAIKVTVFGKQEDDYE